nr:hypothetical protein [Micromonospora endophytica]
MAAAGGGHPGRVAGRAGCRPAVAGRAGDLECRHPDTGRTDPDGRHHRRRFHAVLPAHARLGGGGRRLGGRPAPALGAGDDGGGRTDRRARAAARRHPPGHPRRAALRAPPRHLPVRPGSPTVRPGDSARRAEHPAARRCATPTRLGPLGRLRGRDHRPRADPPDRPHSPRRPRRAGARRHQAETGTTAPPEPGHSRPSPPDPGQSRPGPPDPGQSRPSPPDPGQSRPGPPEPSQSRPGPSGLGRSRPGRWWPLGWWLAALVPVALAVTPLALTAAGQRARQLDWVDAARPADLAALPGGVAQSGVVGGLLLGLAALGLVQGGRRLVLPASCVLIPVALLFLAGLVVPLWVPRYLVFVVPFACLLAGGALASARLPGALAVVALTGLLGLPDQVALRRTHEWPRSATVDYRSAAEIVAAGQRAGDAVVYSPRDSWLFLDLGLRYHLRERTPRDVLLTEDQTRRGDFWATECDRPAECLAGVERIWLLTAGRHSDPLAAVPGPKGDALRTRYHVTQTWPHPTLTLTLLTP